MTKQITKHFLPILIVAIAVFGIYTRLYNMQWGQPFYFHPDERQNVIYPILDSKSFFLLDQKNFDIGPFPLVIIKTTTTAIIHFFVRNIGPDKFEITLLMGRFFSALISILIFFMIAFIATKLYGKKQAIISFILAIFSTGFIQYSHFATIEMWETLYFIVIFYLCIQISKKPTILIGIITGIITGLALSTKLISFIAFPVVMYSFFLFGRKNIKKTFSLNKILNKILMPAWSFFIFSFLFLFLTFPQLLFNFSKVYESLAYESSVTLGHIDVFYTGGFTGTLPIIFQFTKIYPFIINPLLALFFIPCFFIVARKGRKEKNNSYTLLAGVFFILFFSQAFYFAKWTRYYIPTLPFIYLILGIGIAEMSNYIEKNILLKRNYIIKNIFIGIICFISFIFSLSFFIDSYVLTHKAILASSWAKYNIPKDSRITTETFDLGITPFNDNFKNISLFDFYALDTDKKKSDELSNLLLKTDVIIFPGQRLTKSRIDHPEKFPVGFEFYNALLRGQTKFKKIYQTPCETLCKIAYIGNVSNFEETASIFNRPTLTIYKKLP